MDLVWSLDSPHLSFHCVEIYISGEATRLRDLTKKIRPYNILHLNKNPFYY